MDSTANTVTIKGNGSEIIDGANNIVMESQWDALILVSNGTGWNAIGQNLKTTQTEAETGTENTRYSTPLRVAQYITTLIASIAQVLTQTAGKFVTADRVKYNPGVAKAGGSVNGNSAALFGGYGVASVTKGGTGVYVITLSAPMATTSYQIIATVQLIGVSPMPSVWVLNRSTTGFTIRTSIENNSNASNTDESFDFAVFGELA